MRDTKVQWHSGFVAAMDLELMENRDDLIFEKEYNLNTKPLEVDLLIIKKEATAQIASEIGRFFKGHNIIEYKSPDDHLDIDTFYKALAYACLYKSYGKTVDSIKADDITVSILRESKPVELFRYFKEHAYSVTNSGNGIYCIENGVLFPTQIVVTKELDKSSHGWIRALSRGLQKEDIQELVDNRNNLPEKSARELADSVLEVSFDANRQVIEELIGDESMYETLMEIFEPQVKLREEAGLKKGIQGAVDLLRDIGREDAEIKVSIMKKYNLSEEEAEEYLQNA